MLDLLWMRALNLICLYGAEILPVFTQSQIANDLFIYLVLLKNEWIAVWKPLYLNNGGGGGGGLCKEWTDFDSEKWSLHCQKKVP